MKTPLQLREDALAIWHAGVAAVRSDQLIRDNVFVEDGWLCIGDEELALQDINRIIVVGAGKAGAGMAAGLEEVLGDHLLAAKKVIGWVNVPADCVRPLKSIHLHAARPAGVNEPTAEGARGAEEILRLVSAAGENDVVIALISGGGSALLPLPLEGISLEEKLAITRHLSAAGANIRELNTVRKQLSRIKGGGLAKACSAKGLYTLIISDVLGDPLDLIASGPTVEDASSPHDALEILRQYHVDCVGIAPQAISKLKERVEVRSSHDTAPPTCRMVNLVIGNNAVAVDAAGQEAVQRGYSPVMHSAIELEGTADEVGVHLADMAARMRNEVRPDCLITGGEPVVELAPAAIRGKGGRNQQLVLAALARLLELSPHTSEALDNIALLSGGTDGEDGPTDAAGAFIDAEILRLALERNESPQASLRRNDAYRFFAPLDALLHTGPTHTNVCDLRVVVIAPTEA